MSRGVKKFAIRQFYSVDSKFLYFFFLYSLLRTQIISTAHWSRSFDAI